MIRSVPCVDRLAVDGRTLLLLPNQVLELSALALFAYDAARESTTPERLGIQLVERFGAPPGADTSAAVSTLVDELCSLGLLEQVSRPSPEEESPTMTLPVRAPRILLPGPDVDLQRWATIACDQFTSQPDYWDAVDAIIADAPSTARLVLPEIHLGAPDMNARIEACQASMDAYLADGILTPHDALVYVERTVTDGLRRGLVVELDLDAYDFHPRSRALIRATEGTVLDRLPPRMAVRRGASLELPHIIVLYDDPDDTVLAPVLAARDELSTAYDVDLMLDSGHITGRFVQDPAIHAALWDALAALIEPDAYASRYGVDPEAPLLFAMGDGNHSLATAREVWQELKAAGAPFDHPARWALVELVNLHDPSLQFEPIHRVVFDAPTLVADLGAALAAELHPVPTVDEALASLQATGAGQRLGVRTDAGFAVMDIPHPTHELAVGTLQSALDTWLADHPEASVDYVHGEDVTDALGSRPGNVGFLLPPVSKDAFFRSIAVDGPLPRKTFSLGHARDKRFYMEARSLR